MTDSIGPFKGEYRFLSNFYPCQITWEGLTYPTLEHAFAASKTLDTAARERIRKAGTPGKAKLLGRQVTLRSDWELVKLDVMESLLCLKFFDPELAGKLLATGDADLEEVNWWEDRFWGTCNGEGSNHLGRLLMKIRSSMKEASA